MRQNATAQSLLAVGVKPSFILWDKVYSKLNNVQDEEEKLPSQESTTSSVVQSICIIIELIRQNNSDYFEPYLFHTLRNRLIQVQQHLQMHTQDGRDALERAMNEMVNRMGVVHLGPVLDLMCDNLDRLQQFLKQPRSLVSLFSYYLLLSNFEV